MQINWTTYSDSSYSVKKQLSIEYDLRKRLLSRLLPSLEDQELDEDIINDLELCFEPKNHQFRICNIQSIASKILFQHISKDELKNQFNIVGTCSK